MGWPRKSGRIVGTPLGFVPFAAALRMRCLICALAGAAIETGSLRRAQVLTKTTRERTKDYKFKLRTWGVLIRVITCMCVCLFTAIRPHACLNLSFLLF